MTPTSVSAPTTPALTSSLSSGATDVPLIEQTLGAFFDAVAARLPDHEALVSVHQQQRYSYRELQTALQIRTTRAAGPSFRRSKGHRNGYSRRHISRDVPSPERCG